FHRCLVDVQRDRDRVAAGVADGVVLVRRGQAAGAARAGVDAAGGAEAEAFAVALEQFVLGDLEFAVPDPFDAPQAAVVVDRGALAGTPGHRHHAVAVLRAAVQLAARVVVGDRLVHAVGQAHVAVADQPAEHAAQGGGDRVLVAAGHRAVDGAHELVAAGEVEVGGAGAVGTHALILASGAGRGASAAPTGWRGSRARPGRSARSPPGRRRGLGATPAAGSRSRHRPRAGPRRS